MFLCCVVEWNIFSKACIQADGDDGQYKGKHSHVDAERMGENKQTCYRLRASVIWRYTVNARHFCVGVSVVELKSSVLAFIISHQQKHTKYFHAKL